MTDMHDITSPLPEPLLLDYAEAGHILSLNASTVRLLARSGRLPLVILGKRAHRVTRTDVERAAGIEPQEPVATARLLSYAEAGYLLAVSDQTVRALVKSDHLPVAVQTERIHRIRTSDLQAFVDRGGIRAQGVQE